MSAMLTFDTERAKSDGKNTIFPLRFLNSITHTIQCDKQSEVVGNSKWKSEQTKIK